MGNANHLSLFTARFLLDYYNFTKNTKKPTAKRCRRAMAPRRHMNRFIFWPKPSNGPAVSIRMPLWLNSKKPIEWVLWAESNMIKETRWYTVTTPKRMPLPPSFSGPKTVNAGLCFRHPSLKQKSNCRRG